MTTETTTAAAYDAGAMEARASPGRRDAGRGHTMTTDDRDEVGPSQVGVARQRHETAARHEAACRDNIATRRACAAKGDTIQKAMVIEAMIIEHQESIAAYDRARVAYDRALKQQRLCRSRHTETYFQRTAALRIAENVARAAGQNIPPEAAVWVRYRIGRGCQGSLASYLSSEVSRLRAEATVTPYHEERLLRAIEDTAAAAEALADCEARCLPDDELRARGEALPPAAQKLLARLMEGYRPTKRNAKLDAALHALHAARLLYALPGHGLRYGLRLKPIASDVNALLLLGKRIGTTRVPGPDQRPKSFRGVVEKTQRSEIAERILAAEMRDDTTPLLVVIEQGWQVVIEGSTFARQAFLAALAPYDQVV
ncbi:MAG: hypothetical protein Q8Q14_03865 [Gemmatimonadales bacterium]|nr:hypothetical protein [Gemmatimonadales bacterium]